MHPVTVFHAFSAAEAQLVRSRLEVAGYQAQVIHELASLSLDGYSMATGGILVQVPDEQAAEARELITAGPVTDNEPA